MALLHSHLSPLHRRANIVPSLRRTSGYTLTSIARSSSLSRRRSSFEASHARADHDREKRLSDQSSWEAKDSEGDDYLFKLGQEAENMNIAVGARKGVIDDLFVGEFLGKDSDIVFDYRQKATRSFEHLKGDYYITPEFMDKVACHIVKNYLSQSLDIKVPLILVEKNLPPPVLHTYCLPGFRALHHSMVKIRKQKLHLLHSTLVYYS